MKKFLLLSLMLSAAPVLANQVMIADKAGVIPTNQVDQLRSQTNRWPFDIVVMTDNYASPRALDVAVSNCITSPRLVCVGIDPAHHSTNVHFGKALGVDNGSFKGISSAGNPSFKSGDWSGGIAAIADTTASSMRVAPAPDFPAPTYTPPPQVAYAPPPAPAPVVYTQPYVPPQVAAPAATPQESSGGHGFLVFLFVVIFLGGIGYALYRYNQANGISVIPQPWSGGNGSPPPSSGNSPISSFGNSTTRPSSSSSTAPSARVAGSTMMPTHSTVVVHDHHHHSSGVDPILAGAVGFEIGRMTAPQPREVVRETSAPIYNPPVFDGGGASSGWNTPAPTPPPANDGGGVSTTWDAPAPSGGFDSGGGSSSWDSTPAPSDDGGSSSSWDSSDNGGSSSSFDSSPSDTSSSDSGGGSDSTW